MIWTAPLYGMVHNYGMFRFLASQLNDGDNKLNQMTKIRPKTIKSLLES